MGELQFKIVSRKVEQSNFDCGIESINADIVNSYYPTILQHAYAYSIIANNRIVGYFQIMFRDIELNDLPEDISEYDSGKKENKISAVHINFIAIDKRYHRNNLGTFTLRIIIEYVRQLTQRWPIRIITIDARNELIHWYKEEGFLFMPHNRVGQDGVTRAMYMDCFRYQKELNDYIESIS